MSRAAKKQHVVPHGKGWAVKGEGNRRATKVVDKKSAALKVARRIARAQGSDVIIHGMDGKIQEVDGYRVLVS